MSREVHLVTGAFSYSGSHIARALLQQGVAVRTLTNHPDRAHPLAARIEAAPLRLDDPAALRGALQGVRVLYNTFWVRFDRGRATFERAVDGSRRLFAAAREAGVERVVHVSITKPALDSRLPYFRGKAELERALADSGLSFAVLRPTVLFGGRDVLINNIAWALRRLPLFGVAGHGRYRLQPVHVDDLAALAVSCGARRDDVVIDAVGPDALSFEELVRLVGEAIGHPARVVHLPGWAVLGAARIIGLLVRDVFLTPDELDGLRAELLVSDAPPTCPTSLRAWLREHGAALGARYASELGRHYRGAAAYL